MELSRDQLVELVTKEVLAALAERSDILSNPTKLREVVANGADRVSFHGDAEDVPMDLAKYIDHTLLKAEAMMPVLAPIAPSFTGPVLAARMASMK